MLLIDQGLECHAECSHIPHVQGRIAWLLLGSEGAKQFGEATLAFYVARGLMAKVRGLPSASLVCCLASLVV